MIRTILVFGFVGGLLLPARGVWVVVVTSAAWAGIVLIWGSVDSGTEVVGAAAFGAINAAAGFLIGLALHRAVLGVRNLIQRPERPGREP
ncbi:MAG: hypothetical protein Q8Q29_09390 [Actinomycetota bacterium]|nr:hypothetical protein [Actinomycetota bacterium]